MIASLLNLAGPDMMIMTIPLLGLAFGIWMLVDCVQHEKGTLQVGWIIAILLAPLCLGGILYLFCRKLPRSKGQLTD